MTTPSNANVSGDIAKDQAAEAKVVSDEAQLATDTAAETTDLATTAADEAAPPVVTPPPVPVPGPPPAAPVLGKITVSGSSVTVPWIVPAGADGVDVYVDGIKVWSSNWQVPPIPTSTVLTSVAAGTRTVTATAYNSAGEGPQSAPQIITVAAAPAPVPTPTPTPTPTPVSTGKPLIGFYPNSGNTADAVALGKTLGVVAQGINVYTVGGDGWPGIASSVPWYDTNTANLRALFSVALCPNGQTCLDTLNNLATFTTLAKKLVSMGAANAIIRLGWEANGNYPWPGGTGGFAWTTSGGAAYVAAFRAVVAAMRAVAGQAFLFDFNMNYGDTNSIFQDGGGFAAWYPGNDVVDIISADGYDNGYPGSYQPNLEVVIKLAMAQGKPWGVGEYGISDANYQPTFLPNFAALILGQVSPYPAAFYHAYFNADTSVITSVPAAVAAYKLAFG